MFVDTKKNVSMCVDCETPLQYWLKLTFSTKLLQNTALPKTVSPPRLYRYKCDIFTTQYESTILDGRLNALWETPKRLLGRPILGPKVPPLVLASELRHSKPELLEANFIAACVGDVPSQPR